MKHQTIGTSYSFHASHAVADDVASSRMHDHQWTVDIDVRGPIVGPGWVMDYEHLRARLIEAMPGSDESFNEWSGLDNATNEKLVQLVPEAMSLPAGIEVVRVVLTEDETNRAYWP